MESQEDSSSVITMADKLSFNIAYNYMYMYSMRQKKLSRPYRGRAGTVLFA